MKMALPKNAVAFPELRCFPVAHGLPQVVLLFEGEDFAAMAAELGDDWGDDFVTRLDRGDAEFVETALRVGGKVITPRPYLSSDFPKGVFVNGPKIRPDVKNWNDIIDRAGKDITARPISLDEVGDIPAATVAMRIADAIHLSAIGKTFEQHLRELKDKAEMQSEAAA
jgi:hypothetical protein